MARMISRSAEHTDWVRMAGDEMAVYLAAGAVALFYLIMLPVRAGLAWKSGQPVRVGVTIGPIRFSTHGEIKYAAGAGLIASLTHDRSGKVRQFGLLQKMADSAALASSLSALSGALQYLFRHVSPWKLRARCHLSCPNAAHTALLYGALRSGFSVLRAARPDLPLSASISADFRSMRTQLDFCGILSCRLGHIMAAALIWSRDFLTRRIQAWITNSRSKAS